MDELHAKEYEIAVGNGDACAVNGDSGVVDELFMRAALEEARAAAAEGEVPIGAVVVYEGRVIARAHNRRELDEDPSAHAEFIAMTEAARVLGRWRLTGCAVYVTLEPCLMCAGLMVNARVDRCVYGAADPKGGAVGTLYRVHDDARLNHAFGVTSGVLERECAGELLAFFARLRGKSAVEAGQDAVCVATACHANSAKSTPMEAPRVVLAIDSFKGSVSSVQAEMWVREGVLAAVPRAQVHAVPIADGGEGTLDALRETGGFEEREVRARDPFGRGIGAHYLVVSEDEAAGVGDANVAVVESAQVIGLDRSPRTSDAALAASSAGVGDLVLDAIAHGAQTIYIGLGGTATTDGGLGFLRALGAHITDGAGAEVAPGLAGLAHVAHVDLGPAFERLGKTRLIALSDVKNPLVGRRGAVKVFGLQKGLDPACVDMEACDGWMIQYGRMLDKACRTYRSPLFRSLAGVLGAGAAGGLGAAVLALGGVLESGVDTMLDMVGFDELAMHADLVITGEGFLDEQTVSGKAPMGVARRAHRINPRTRVVALAGGRVDDLTAVYQAGIDLVLPIERRPMSLDVAMRSDETCANLRTAGETAMQAYLLGR